ncbi:MAG: transporter substrate-binding domain-containing protein [Pseudodesulfovibrio sp.]|nr:transporter substrate-binding domain-containing protein [Pseudodesulfovibrio sp.]
MRQFRYNLIFLAITLVTACATLTVMPSTTTASNKAIILFIPDTDWPPYLISDSNHPDKGVFVEVLMAVATPLGYTVQTRRLPNKRGWLLLEEGVVDAHPKAKEWIKNPERYNWTDPFMTNEDVLLYTASKDSKFTNPESLFGKTVATINGFIYPALEKHFASGEIKRVDVASPYAMLGLLDLNRVDAALVNRSETQWLFRNRPDLKPEKFHMDDTPFDSAEYRYAFTKSKDWQPFITEFNEALNTMKQNGQLKAILDQYR